MINNFTASATKRVPDETPAASQPESTKTTVHHRVPGEASWNSYIHHHWYYGQSPSDRDEYTSMDYLHDAVKKGNPEAIIEYRHIVRGIRQAQLIPACFFGIFLGFVMYLIVGAIYAGIAGAYISPFSYIAFYYISVAIIYILKAYVFKDPWILK